MRITMKSRHGFRKSNHGFKLSNGDTVGGAGATQGISLSQFAITINQNTLRLLCYLRVNCSTKTDVALHLLFRKRRLDSIVAGAPFGAMNIEDMLCNTTISLWVTIVQNNKEQIESTKKGSAQRDISLESFGAVVATVNGIGGCQNGSPCVQSRLNTRLGDTNCLSTKR